MRQARKELRLEDLTGEDSIIVLVGLTGSGISSFVATATAQIANARKGKNEFIGHGLESHRSGIRAVRFPHPRTLRPFVLVDTPGFDNSRADRSDDVVATTIARWLREKFGKAVKLAGIIYLHRVTDNRLPNSLLENIQRLVALCGSDAIKNITIATTMWGNKGSLELKRQRTAELETQMKANQVGMKVEVMQFGDSFVSAWNIIDTAAMIDRGDLDDTRFHQELSELGGKINDRMGREKFKKLQESLAVNRDILRKLLEGESDERLLHEITAQYENLRKTLQAMFDHLSDSPTKAMCGRWLTALLSYKRLTPKLQL